MSKTFRILTMLYLIFLAVVMGASLFAGAVVAPVIFNTADVFGENILSHFQEGMIMTEHFVRLSYATSLTALVVVIYEGYRFKKGDRDALISIAALLVLATGLLFSFYFVPEIVMMQQEGEQATQSQFFLNIHKASEINLKIFLFAVLILLIRHLQRHIR